MTTSAGRILEGKEAKNDGNDDAIMSVGAPLQAYMAPLSFKQKHGDKNIPRKSQRSHSSRIHWSHWDWRFNTNWDELCWHIGLQSLYVNPGVTIDALTTELVVDPFIWPHSPKDHGNISHTVAKGSLPAGLMNEST